MLKQFESLDVTPEEDESCSGLFHNIKTYLRQNIVEGTQRVLCSLQDTVVSSKFVLDGIGE